jgi:hypothetical protein
MIPYLILIVTTILVGLAAVLFRRTDSQDRKTFLTGSLLNAGALLGVLLLQNRRRK